MLPYLASYDDERMVAADSERLDGRIEFDGDGRITVLRGQASRLALALDRKPLTTLDDAAFDWSRNAGRHDSGAIHPDTAGQTLDFALSGLTLEATKLEPDIFGTLGRKLDRVAGQISLRGKLQHDRITAETLGRWRDAGGTLELADIIIDWGPLRLAGAGTLALDDALQPVGALTAQIAGLDRLLDLLERSGQVRPQQAAIARIALAVLTHTPADGGPPRAEVPVGIQNQQLSIGPVPLLRLPVIVWQ